MQSRPTEGAGGRIAEWLGERGGWEVPFDGWSTFAMRRSGPQSTPTKVTFHAREPGCNPGLPRVRGGRMAEWLGERGGWEVDL